MTWEDLKTNLYFEDGSFRDIYILNTDIDDWAKWIDYVNEHHKVEFIINDGTTSNTIIKEKVLPFIKDRNKVEYTPSAFIYLGKVMVNIYFFMEQEIDNDISPKEFTSIENHNALMSYLTDISIILNKKVLITQEMRSNEPLLEVDGNEIRIIRHPDFN